MKTHTKKINLKQKNKIKTFFFQTTCSSRDTKHGLWVQGHVGNNTSSPF